MLWRIVRDTTLPWARIHRVCHRSRHDPPLAAVQAGVMRSGEAHRPCPPSRRASRRDQEHHAFAASIVSSVGCLTASRGIEGDARLMSYVVRNYLFKGVFVPHPMGIFDAMAYTLTHLHIKHLIRDRRHIGSGMTATECWRRGSCAAAVEVIHLPVCNMNKRGGSKRDLAPRDGDVPCRSARGHLSTHLVIPT
jgi:hypothetical protein